MSKKDQTQQTNKELNNLDKRTANKLILKNLNENKLNFPKSEKRNPFLDRLTTTPKVPKQENKPVKLTGELQSGNDGKNKP